MSVQMNWENRLKSMIYNDDTDTDDEGLVMSSWKTQGTDTPDIWASLISKSGTGYESKTAEIQSNAQSTASVQRRQ